VTSASRDVDDSKEIAVLKGHTSDVNSAVFSGDGKRVVTASGDKTARIWDVTWATLVRGDALRERVCAEKLIGAAQEFTDGEMEDPILRASTRTIRSRVIRACAVGHCRSTTGHAFQASYGVPRAGSSA
jgi:WD domain, G-beta repeat